MAPGFPARRRDLVQYSRKGDDGMPGYVYLPDYAGWGEFARFPGPYAGFLGKRYDPLISECDPHSAPGDPKPSPGKPNVVRGTPRLAAPGSRGPEPSRPTTGTTGSWDGSTT